MDINKMMTNGILTCVKHMLSYHTILHRPQYVRLFASGEI